MSKASLDRMFSKRKPESVSVDSKHLDVDVKSNVIANVRSTDNISLSATDDEFIGQSKTEKSRHTNWVITFYGQRKRLVALKKDSESRHDVLSEVIKRPLLAPLHEQLKKFEDDYKDGLKIEYFIGQIEECPTSGRLHVQCYLQTVQQITLRTLRKYFGDDKKVSCGAWIAPARGTPAQCIAYCSKSRGSNSRWDTKGVRAANTEVVTWGQPSLVVKGERTDLKKLYSDIESKSTYAERKAIVRQFRAEHMHHYNTMRRTLQELLDEVKTDLKYSDVPRSTWPVTAWLYGPANSLKSSMVRSIVQRYPGHSIYYWKYGKLGSEEMQNYQGEAIIVFEELEGSGQMVSWGRMKSLVNYIPDSIRNTGGNYVNNNARLIIVCSNVHPRRVYRSTFGGVKPVIAPVSGLHIMPDTGLPVSSSSSSSSSSFSDDNPTPEQDRRYKEFTKRFTLFRVDSGHTEGNDKIFKESEPSVEDRSMPRYIPDLSKYLDLSSVL